MMRTLLLLTCLLSASCSMVYGQVYNMSNNTVTDASGTLYDSGGPNSDYGNNEDLVFTVCPTGGCDCITIDFEDIELEFSFGTAWDVLRIYEGNSTSAPLFGTFGGSPNNLPNYHIDSDCVTFHFESDNIINWDGWELEWNCSDDSCPESIETSTNTYTTTELVEDVFVSGNCVEISNITFTGSNSARGSFSNGSSSIGIEEGIVLSTGFLNSIPGFNYDPDSTDDLPSNNGDSDLDDIVSSTGESTTDASVLEFDFIPTTDEISFNYVFASDEYPEYVCSGFNDVFAFFISGPGITGEENIALIPGTSTAVAINSLNNGSVGSQGSSANCTSLGNSAYYVDNYPGNYLIEYDGFTTVLTASATVTACETYHIKLAVADVGDAAYDSAVFLEANSFEAGDGALVSASVNSAPSSSNEMYEGCQDGFFLFERGNTEDLSQPFTIDFEVTGTATPGIDYSPLPSSVTIPAGQTSVQIDITPYLDGIIEGTENIIVTLLNDTCGCSDDDNPPGELLIMDSTPIEANIPEQAYCFGDPANLSPNATGGVDPLTYEWSNGSTNPTIDFIVNALTSGIYYVTVTDDCDNQETASVSVTYETGAPPISIDPIDPLCFNSDPVDLVPSHAGGTWSGPGITDATAGTFDPATALITGASPFSITYNLSSNCGDASETIDITFEDPPTATISGSGMLCPGETADIDLTISFTGTSPWSFTYAIDAVEQPPIDNITDNPYTLTVNSAGDYTITAVGDTHCEGTVSGLVSITEFEIPDITISGGGTLCGINDIATIQFDISGGTSPYTVTYTDGTNDFTDSGITGSFSIDAINEGTFEIVSITDANGCPGTFSGLAEVNQGDISIDSATPNTANCGNANGSVNNIVISGGEAPISYSWLDDTDTPIGSNPELTDVAAGTYTLIVIDGLLCSDTLEVTIDETLPPMVDLGTAVDATCGQSNGSITGVSVSGGQEPYFYFWKDADGNIIGNDIDLIDVLAGDFTLLVSDFNGCQDSIQMTIEDMPPPNLSAGEVIDASCGENNGSIGNIDLVGGTAPFSFSWTDASGQEVGNSLVLNDVPAGTYTLNMTDENDCTGTISFTIGDSEAPEINAATVQPSTCGDANGGVSDIFVQGGTAPLFYEWQDENGWTVSEDLFLDGVLAGSYTLIITDVYGCMDELTYTITNIPAPFLNGGETTSALCGGENGAITAVNVEGGTEPIEFQWTNSNGEIVGNELDLEGVGLGDYTLTIIDANGCMDEISFGVLELPPPTLQSGTVMPATCGDENGAIEGVNIEGGAAPYQYEWRNTADSLIATTSNLANVFSGTYTVFVTDGNDCEVSLAIEIEDTPTPEITGGEVIPSSCGNSDGAIGNVEASGGTGELSFEWQNSSGEILGAGAELTDVPQGNYTLIVTDENGCETSAIFDIADLEAPQLIGGEAQNTTCSEANGSIGGITLEGGVAPFTYEWQNTNGEAIHSGDYTPEVLELTNITEGTYTIIVTDSKDCAVSLQFNIEDAPSPQLAEGFATETICGEANGSIGGISIEGGTAPFTFEWRNESGEIVGEEVNIDNLLTGTYTLQITDFNGCKDAIEMFVPELLPPQLQGGEATPTTCSEANGSIFGIEVLEGTAPFEYRWTDEQGEDIGESPILENVLAGTYHLEVMDANGCLTTLQWTIEDQAGPQLEGGAVLPSSCGNNDGSIQEISVIGGTGELTFEWQNVSGETLGNEMSINEIPAGEYTLFVTDENGCEHQLSFTTFDEAAPQLSGGEVDSSNCGQSDGNITDISIEGGNAPYTYLWTNENGEPYGEEINLSNVPQGNYVLTATDVDGCITTLSFEIIDTETPQLMGGLVEPTTCSEANGNIEGIEAIGGNGTLSFSWLDNENSEIGSDLNLENVLAGTYTLIATDEEGCATELQFDIPDESAPQILEGLVNNARCSEANGGISNVLIEGGTPPYEYAWSDALSNAYDNSGTGSEANLQNIAAGNYTLVVTDANGCLANLEFEVSDEAGPTALSGAINASTCSEANGSIASPEIEGGTAPFRYEWRDVNGNLVGEEAELNGVLAGNYSVLIQDDNGCETALEFEITDIPAPILSEGTIDLSSCGNSDGGVSAVKVEGGTAPYTYLWQDENGETYGEEVDLQNVNAGAYTLFVTDSNGCEVSLGFNISDVGAPEIIGGEANQTICGSEDGQITGIEVSGGTGALIARWTNTAGEVISENLEIFDLLAGEYTFTVEDEGGCIASESFVIEDIPPPVILGATITQASCGESDGRISEVAIEAGTAPFVYEWRNVDTEELLSNEPEISNLSAGNYLLILTDANLCGDSREFVLENLDAPELSLEEVTISDCLEEGTGSATVKVLGGTTPFNFEWNTDPPQFSPTATNLRPGDYMVSVRDGNNCLTTLSVNVPGFIPPPIVDCIEQTTESLSFSWEAVTGAIGYLIETDLGTSETVAADQLSYVLEGIDDDLTVVISVTALGPDFCDNSETAIQSCTTLADCPTIEVTLSVPNDTFCADEAAVNLTVTPSGGIFEGLGMNGNLFDPASAGVGIHTITYTFTDEMGCEFTANQTFVVVEPPMADMEIPQVICLGETATVSFNGTLPEGASLQWDFGNGTSSNEIGPHTLDWSETGSYTVQVSVDNGVCMDEASMDLVVSDISIETSEDQTVRSGTDIELNVIVNTEFGELQSLEWQASFDNLTGCMDCLNTSARPFDATNYTIVATNEYGCEAVADILVDIIPVPILSVPNAFSPNGDGVNDIFQIQGRNIESINFKIFSRWGEMVFEGNSLQDYWNGVYKDEKLELGVYVYYARAFSFDGEEVFVQGNVTLIR